MVEMARRCKFLEADARQGLVALLADADQMVSLEQYNWSGLGLKKKLNLTGTRISGAPKRVVAPRYIKTLNTSVLNPSTSLLHCMQSHSHRKSYGINSFFSCGDTVVVLRVIVVAVHTFGHLPDLQDVIFSHTSNNPFLTRVPRQF
jgi:hypothetical protein